MLDANLAVDDMEVEGWHFNRFSGQLHWRHDEIRLTHAELRGGSGMVAGDILYRPDEAQTEFNISGTGLALEKIKNLQSPSLAIGGQLDVNLHGGGSVLAADRAGRFSPDESDAGDGIGGRFRAASLRQMATPRI